MRLSTIIKVFFALLIALCTLGTWGYASYSKFLVSPISVDHERVFVISQGDRANDVIVKLANSGIVTEKLWMRILLDKSGMSSKLQPGNFVLTEDMTPNDLIQALTRTGKYLVRSYVLQAGSNIYDIARQLHEARIVDEKVFLSKALNPEFCAELGVPADSLEGYLGTGVYRFAPSLTEEEVIAEMHQRFLDAWTSIVQENEGVYERYAKNYRMTDHELLTLASIVEKEAVVESEKAVIARVFLNRLNKKMPLQSDPTCVYPPKELGEKPSPSRCKTKDNLYSTYIHRGLPPGPISCPNNNSLVSIFKPYTGADYKSLLYFVAKNDGTWKHYFSKTLTEHNQAVRYFLKGKKEGFERKTPQP